MKSLLMGLLTIVTFSANAQVTDPGVGTAAAEFKENLTKKLNDLKSKLDFQINSNMHLNFSDYEVASKKLLRKIEQAEKIFQPHILYIENYLSGFATIRNNQTNEAMELLLKKKKSEFEKIQKRYENAAIEFIRLDGQLDLLVKLQRPKSGEGPLLFYYYDRPYLINGKNSYLRDQKGDMIKYRMPELFNDCKTQGCVYYLATDYMLWLNKSQSMLETLETKMSGLKNLKGPRFLTSKKSIKKAFEREANNVADKLPLSL